MLLQDLGVDMNGSHRDLIRACGRDLLLRCQMLLELLAIPHASWLRVALILGEGSVIWVEGVALAVGACGMWKEKEDGGRVWITCLYRRGRVAWRSVAGEEAALQTRSEGFNLERKAETREMWLSVRGRGRGGR